MCIRNYAKENRNGKICKSGKWCIYFRPVRELQSGYGFADLVYIPKPKYQNSHPALLIELKWNKNAETAITQIKEKKYPESIEEYTGDILLVGISYDKKTKVHECVIEKYKKE